jgi:hypothetical protein
MRKPALGVAAVLIFVCLSMTQCTESPNLSSIQIIPSDAALTFVGQTLQYKAIGTYSKTGHPSMTKDITNQVTWASVLPSAATISSTGLVTAAGAGTTQITATAQAWGGPVIGTSNLTVAGDVPHDLTSINVIPGNQTVMVVGNPTQFIAIGSFNSAPMTEDVTDLVKWESSDVDVATINNTGLALLNNQGSTTITAVGTSASGASITGSSTIAIGPGGSGPTLPLLSVYEVGLGSGTVTDAAGAIKCTTNAASSAGCTGNFVLNSTATLTATPAAGSTFGGWSANCTPSTAPTCSVVMSNNEPVGAIFNQQ